MTDNGGEDRQPNAPAVRHLQRNDPEHVELRELDESDDGMMSIRLPIASTGEVRNQGDDPLTREELDGMARQVDDLTTGVFPDHGLNTDVSGGRYSQLEKMGYWSDGDVVSDAADDGSDLLMASANMPDPDTLSEATGEYRQALAVYKAQAERGIPIDASIGWRKSDSHEGGNDLMEASIVGIGADWRTNTEQTSADASALVARAALDAGADGDALVDSVRAAVDSEEQSTMTDDNDESGDEPDSTQESDGMDSGEYREFMRKEQQQQTEILRVLAESLREDDYEDDEDEDDEDEDDDDGDEQSSEPDNEQSAADEERAEELADELDELRSELDKLRSGGLDADDVNTSESDEGEERDADDGDGEESDEQTQALDKGEKYGIR